MPGLIGQHPVACPAAAPSFLPPDFLDASALGGGPPGAEGLDLFEEQSPGEKAIEPLLARALTFHLETGWAVGEHNTGGGFVHVLAAVPPGPHEGFFEVRFVHPQRLHPERKLLLFLETHRKTGHGRKLADLPEGRNGLSKTACRGSVAD